MKGIKCTDVDIAGTVVYVAINGIYAGYLVVANELKPDSRKAVSFFISHPKLCVFY